MRAILLAMQVNDTLNTSLYWTIGFSMFLRLLDDTKLIREKLGIYAVGRDQILIAMGAKFSIPVPRNTLYLLDLAERMETILLQIERTHWTIDSAQAWYASENFWKLTFNAYYRVWGKDFMQMAVHSFPTMQSISNKWSFQCPVHIRLYHCITIDIVSIYGNFPFLSTEITDKS